MKTLIIAAVAFFLSIGLYIQFGIGGFKFNGLASGDDDDNDDHYSPVIKPDTSNIGGGFEDFEGIGDSSSSTPTKPTTNSSSGCHVTSDSSSTSIGSMKPKYHYNASALLDEQDTFHISDANWYGGVFSDPPHPSISSQLLDLHHEEELLDDNIGYMQYPYVFNNTIVFCSEGDVYLTTIDEDKIMNKAMPAMRLTSTVGNVNSPTINPHYPYLIAFTATYSGHREVYLMDLRPEYRSRPSMRLTYMDSNYGVLSISGWEDDGTTLVVSSYNMEVAMEDVRLYKIGVLHAKSNTRIDGNDDNIKENDVLVDTRNKTKESKEGVNGNRRKTKTKNRLIDSISPPITVSSIKPIPLSQAIDSVVDNDTHCRFFTRFKQSSNTVRYVGGTAEHLWAYCEEENFTVPLTHDYRGTSKAPKIYKNGDEKYLFFLSDRAINNDDKNEESKWLSSTMNLWAVSVPKKYRLYKNEDLPNMAEPFQITSISCHFNGMHLQEYAIDAATGNVILRIGADLQILKAADVSSTLSQKGKGKIKPLPLPIAVYSDFNNLHERILPLNNPGDVSVIDIFDSGFGLMYCLMTARGQLFANPVIGDTSNVHPFGGGGMNIPARRYRIAPGSMTGGMVRLLGSWHIPCNAANSKRMALILASDPLSSTAELAFYIIDVSADSETDFTDANNLPTPLYGGHVTGGSVPDGGLGSVDVDSVEVSPCGRRVAWTDKDGNIRVMALSANQKPFTLPKVNENKEPVMGIEAQLTFSPSGRYIAIEHSARNQFQVISIADFGDPSLALDIAIIRFVQATPDRFNSMNPLWGRAPVDFKLDALDPNSDNDPKKTTILYFLTDRDVILSQNTSPWGTRAPSPFFSKLKSVFALPLVSKEDQMVTNEYEEIYGGSFVGGGASELMVSHLDSWIETEEEAESTNNSTETSMNETSTTAEAEVNETDIDEVVYGVYTVESTSTPDTDISFDGASENLTFARNAYPISEIPASNYLFLHQLDDDASIIVAEFSSGRTIMKAFAIGDFPENSLSELPLESTLVLQALGVSTNRKYLYFTYSGKTKVIKNTAADFMSVLAQDMNDFTKNIVDTEQWSLSIWPKLEYQQMYSDAWRMLRDYYYDKNMGGIDWIEVHSRYLPLVSRCGRREELDDVLRQMAAELSALHVFVYGGEYNDPMHGNEALASMHSVASLGAALERSVEWKGYIVKEVPETDPDFNPLDGSSIYSPLSERTLRMSGQRGLVPGDVIVAVNGESVMNVPDIHMLLRGLAGRSIRLDVLRLKSKSSFSIVRKRKLAEEDDDNEGIESEPVIVVPISGAQAENLRYAAWEWKTRQLAKNLAKENGFTIGYTHLRSMSGAEGEDSFVRGFYPDFDKDALIVDVRHNHGGNIDSWLLDTLQRKAWSFWQGRATNITTGGLGWDEQFAFRGHIVILIDEKTSSDGEGFSRGISELGLGKLVGTRTWGGGIWLSSDNQLVDGGIATAPEYGTYNANFGWGLGIEQMGVEPDIEVDNDPRKTFDGRDEQLEKGIQVLKEWLEAEPVVLPQDPGLHRDMSLHSNAEACEAE